MKLRVLTGLLLFYSVAFAQKDSALITGAGTATGMASSVQIGSKGGRLQSADGKLEIVLYLPGTGSLRLGQHESYSGKKD